MKSRTEFSLITGPGNHAHYLIRALNPSLRFDYAEYWPKYRYVSTGNIEGSIIYDWTTFLSYGLYNKLKKVFGNKWHQDVLFWLYDYLNSRNIKGKNLIAWPQVSLQTMKAVQRKGGKIIIDQPMIHIDLWDKIHKGECDLWGVKDHAVYSTRMKRKIKEEYRIADKIMVPSSFSFNSFTQHGIEKEKIVLCPYGIDLPENEEYNRKHNGKLKLVYVGRMEILKGVHYLMQAVKEMGGGQVELHLAGAVQPNFHSFMKKYDGHYHYHGILEAKDVDRLYRMADVFVFPSLFDSFGMVMLEAMSRSLPVIATPHSAGPDLITDFENGFVVPLGQSNALIEKIQWLIANKVKLRDFGYNAHLKIKNEYSFELYRERIVNNITASFK